MNKAFGIWIDGKLSDFNKRCIDSVAEKTDYVLLENPEPPRNELLFHLWNKGNVKRKSDIIRYLYASEHAPIWYADTDVNLLSMPITNDKPMFADCGTYRDGFLFFSGANGEVCLNLLMAAADTILSLMNLGLPFKSWWIVKQLAKMNVETISRSCFYHG